MQNDLCNCVYRGTSRVNPKSKVGSNLSVACKIEVRPSSYIVAKTNARDCSSLLHRRASCTDLCILEVDVPWVFGCNILLVYTIEFSSQIFELDITSKA